MRLGLIAWCNALAALHPDDAELASARAQLRERGFLPPAPRELPEGTPAEVGARLKRRTAAELAELAGALVTLPDPDAEAERAGATMELLLRVLAEAERAERLLERIEAAGSAEAADLALWRFRLGAARLDARAQAESDRWEALLSEVRAVPSAARVALRLAASSWLGAVDRGGLPGASWLVPVDEGRYVVNAWLARLRRPALAAPDALGPAFEWLDEAAALDAPNDAPEVADLIGAAERADRAGEVGAANRYLLEAAAAATDDDLDSALAARAALLVAPSLGARAAATQTALARRRVPGPSAEAVTPPRRDWTGRLLALVGTTPKDDSDLGLYESAGSSARAARAWLERGDLPALLQAARLRDELTTAERAQLATRLGALTSSDETELAASAEAREAAYARWWLLPQGLERRLLFARLAALLPDATSTSDDAAEADDDPHSVANRLAAAADLLDAGRLEAAVAVLIALLRRLEGAPELTRLATLCAGALESDPPPAELVEAVEKHLHAGDTAGEAVLAALLANPTAGFAVHETLLALGADVSRPDAYRCDALAAWLAIWGATATPPSDTAIAPIARTDAGLLALAAARVAGAEDPVAVAIDHLTRLPLGAPDDARADDLLAIALGRNAI